MPDARELTRMLKDFQELIPAVVGAIVALATAIGLLVPSLEGGSSNIGGADNGGTTNSQGGYSKPDAAGVKYLTDSALNDSSFKVKSGYDVTVNGKDYKKSILSTDGQGYASESHKVYVVPNTMRTLSLKAAWSDTIPNNGGVGKVAVWRDGQLLGKFTVPVGEVVERTFDVRGGGRVEIYLAAHDPKNDQNRVPSSGLAVLTPIVK
ncbi:hypothetical protein [uncultured Corynebacterium sp.]|uniref:hypothetical protein n=1 Tax=uncultured Corynebacterium sp. TaxID=159447 RepID=UPI0025E9C967|nr:hypothetical protein [uncultured Corynebacterium sp.]